MKISISLALSSCFVGLSYLAGSADAQSNQVSPLLVKDDPSVSVPSDFDLESNAFATTVAAAVNKNDTRKKVQFYQFVAYLMTHTSCIII